MIIGLNTDWKNCKDVDGIKSLVDRGILPDWKDCQYLKKKLSNDETKESLEYMVFKFFERYDNRLTAEISLETIMTWIAAIRSETLISVFLEAYLSHPHCEKSTFTFVEILLGSDYSEHSHQKEMFALAVSLTCELGIAYHQADLVAF